MEEGKSLRPTSQRKIAVHLASQGKNHDGDDRRPQAQLDVLAPALVWRRGAGPHQQYVQRGKHGQQQE